MTSERRAQSHVHVGLSKRMPLIYWMIVGCSRSFTFVIFRTKILWMKRFYDLRDYIFAVCSNSRTSQTARLRSVTPIKSWNYYFCYLWSGRAPTRSGPKARLPVPATTVVTCTPLLVGLFGGFHLTFSTFVDYNNIISEVWTHGTLNTPTCTCPGQRLIF